MRYFRPLATIS